MADTVTLNLKVIIYDLIRNPCEFLGFIEALNEESIIILHSCSTSLDLNRSKSFYCHENHAGNTPRSIMTKGTSTRRKNRLPGYLYGNFDPGDQDKLMITYYRDPTHDYSLFGACGVIYQGDIHFFGGYIDPQFFITRYTSKWPKTAVTEIGPRDLICIQTSKWPKNCPFHFGLF